MRIERGFSEDQRSVVAALFWQAFSGKLGRVMAPEARALAFIEEALQPDHALVACSEHGRILGVAGFKTRHGGLIAGEFPELARSYGWFGALWRGPLLDLMDRPLKDGQMLLDGIFVDRDSRGMGVGSALIEAAVAEARGRGLTEVRLDVIDTNLRARALYERHGFVPAGREHTGIFAIVFGFRHATKMCRAVGPA